MSNQEKYRVQSYGKTIKVTKEMLIDDEIGRPKNKGLSQSMQELRDALRELKEVILKANEWWLLPVANWLARRLK